MTSISLHDHLQLELKRGEGLYLYCFAQGCALECLKAVEREGSLFSAIPYRDLLAVVRTVSLEEFCGSDAEKNMQEIDWIVPRVQQHEAVIEQSMVYSPVFPVPFGKIFSSLPVFMDFFESNYEAIIHFLKKIDRIEEWSVKGLFNKECIKNDLLQSKINQNVDHLNSLKKGMRYFQEKKMEKEAEVEVFDHLRGILDCEFKELSQYAVAVVERQLIQGMCDSGFKMASNWAFLISPSQSNVFKLKIQSINAAIADKGLHFEVSGPWPPYSFCPILSQNSMSHVE